jgi:hypothetical protein
MSPRNFAKMNELPINEEVLEKIQPGMNLWFAFFSVTGIDKAITKMFVFTPDVINDKLNSDIKKR